MSKRLLKENVALKKIELSLKLQGKSFKASFLSCSHCKFHWGNTPMGKRPEWPSTVDAVTGYLIKSAVNKPEKYGWVCFKYKHFPYHSLLRLNVVRTNSEGKVIPRKSYWLSPPNPMEIGRWVNEPRNGEKDTLELKPAGRGWLCSICRRFEACPR